jgi:UDP-N-acetyl-D-glucosamine dehydrogenase
MGTALAELQTSAQILAEKIRTRQARVGIMGLGYVGLPLAVAFAKAGFSVTGIDLSDSKTAQINAGDSYVGDVASITLAWLVNHGKLKATVDFSVVRDLDTVNICVPTPLRKTKDPDMSYIVSACGGIAKYLHPGMLVILESTTYPGTTDELVLPMLEQGGLKVGQDFSCVSRPSAWILATRNTTPRTFRKSLAARRPHVPRWATCFTRRRSNTSWPSARHR